MADPESSVRPPGNVDSAGIMGTWHDGLLRCVGQEGVEDGDYFWVKHATAGGRWRQYGLLHVSLPGITIIGHMTSCREQMLGVVHARAKDIKAGTILQCLTLQHHLQHIYSCQ